jgi:hypothetical protein
VIAVQQSGANQAAAEQQVPRCFPGVVAGERDGAAHERQQGADGFNQGVKFSVSAPTNALDKHAARC